MPAIARWPGVIPAGRVTDQAAITMDWTATILAATGTEPDPAFPLDGEDLMPICTGARAVYDRTLFWRIRIHDAARMGKWKYLAEGGREHLFDVVADPGEEADLKTKYPEVFVRISEAYQKWNAAMLPKINSLKGVALRGFRQTYRGAYRAAVARFAHENRPIADVLAVQLVDRVGKVAILRNIHVRE